MKKKIYILFSILVSIISASIVNVGLQNDTFSAIKIGDYIIKHGIDFKEHFNYDSTLTYHNARWLFNVIVSFIYNNLGFIGIFIFVVLLSILLGLLLFNVLYKRNKSLLLSFIITALTMSYLTGFISARAQTISYILFFLEMVFIEKLIEKNKIKYSIYLIIISILIANIHTTVWPITIVLFIPYFMEYLISSYIKGKILYCDVKNIKLLFITFILVALSGFITPLGLLPYTYMFKTMSGISTRFIMELKPVNIFFDFNILLLFIIYIYLFIYRKKKIKISDIFMVTGLFILAIMAIRNEAFFILLCTLSLSRTTMNQIDNDKLYKIEDKLLKEKFIIIIIIICAFLISGFNYLVGIHNKEFINRKDYPVDAVNYIKENIDTKNMRIYNGFSIGSYLEFNDIKVFVDSRSEVYCKEFNNTSILQDYYDLYYFKNYYKGILNKYNFTHLLIENDTPLYQYIYYDKDYKIIYSDVYFTIFEHIKDESK